MPAALEALVPIVLTPGGLSPFNLTSGLTGAPLSGGATGVTFPNTGKEIIVVETTATVGGCTVTSDIGTTVQGQAVAGEQVTQALSTTQIYGPYPSQFDAQNMANPPTVEIDFGTPGNIAAVLCVRLPGVE